MNVIWINLLSVPSKRTHSNCVRQYSLLFTRSNNIIHCYLFLILIHQLTQNLRSQDPDPQLVATIGNRKSKSKSERKSQLRGNILDVVSLETSPGNKPRFVVINDLGVIIEIFTFRRIEDLLEQLGFACLLSLERNWRCRIIGRRFRRDTRIYI